MESIKRHRDLNSSTMNINGNDKAKESTMKQPRAIPRQTRPTHHNRYRVILTITLVIVSFIASLSKLHQHASLLHSTQAITDETNAVLPPPQTRRLANQRIPLSKLTTRQVSAVECPTNLVLIEDRIVARGAHYNNNTHTAIPHVIHQTSKSRCLVPSLAETVQKWKDFLPEYTYHLHDDTAVETLLSLPKLQQTFPLLKQVALQCTRGAMRADLWRYVLLWEYGGIYSDIDTYPNTTFILPQDVDAYFVLETDGLLSQYFMAIAPRHPLMYYTIQHTVMNLLKSPDPRKAFAPTVTGPRALHQGLQTYCGNHYKIPDSEGQWLGMNHPLEEGGVFTVGNHTVRVDGDIHHADDIIVRDAIPREDKKRQYQQMGMTYFMQDARTAPQGESCLSLLRQSLENEGKLE